MSEARGGVVRGMCVKIERAGRVLTGSAAAWMFFAHKRPCAERRRAAHCANPVAR
jgi:hypothetical protein